MEIFETRLPGIGVRYEFTNAAGARVGVLVRRDGRREVLLYDERDPDRCRASLELSVEDSAALVELLGGSKVTERISDLRHEVDGLSIEWVTIPAEGGLSGRSIGDGRVRTATGASVVAVIRGATSVPGPGPEFVLEPGDVALVTGSAEGVQLAAVVLTGRGIA
jgi:TrkA domain protein